MSIGVFDLEISCSLIILFKEVVMFIVKQAISLENYLYFHLISSILEDSMQFHVLLD
jgi:hypothetical protein